MRIVKSDSINRMDKLNIVLFIPMTLEGILFTLHLWIHVEVLHSHSALDRAHHKPLLIRKTAYASGLKLQTRVSRLGHAHVV